MHKLRLNPLVLKDLKAIRQYISVELDNPTSARKIVTGIIEAYEKLQDFPLLGTSLSSKIDVNTDYRFLVCGNYLIFYKSDNEYVSIYRILYAKRDYLNILFANET
jgi:addiction module RelE/StbE family toxin